MAFEKEGFHVIFVKCHHPLRTLFPHVLGVQVQREEESHNKEYPFHILRPSFDVFLSILDIYALCRSLLQRTTLEVVNLVVGGRRNGNVLDALR